MSDKYIFVEHLSNLNEIIKQPLVLTQRIKFTCFDVSEKYIVFGATSGGVYIFRRAPCEFIKLIPNNEGCIVEISVSDDEKCIVVASAKGRLMVLEDCFNENDNINYKQFDKNGDGMVTALKWLGHDVYCGDSNGLISVITLPTMLTKAIFQKPNAVLMYLDSSIVQFDTFSKYMLISTKTRSYFCDTESEFYKQIGQKLRDVPLGACFFNTPRVPKIEQKQSSVKNFFHVLKENDDTKEIISGVKIFCARPGLRLWEVDFQCEVVCTHQFKKSLVQLPAEMISLSDEKEARLEMTDFPDTDRRLSNSISFGKIFSLINQFIFTFSKNAIYIFQPETDSLIFWTNYSNNIKDAKIVKNFVYIWTEDYNVQIISVNLLEDLILKTLFNKQYFLCAEMCVNYKDYVLSLIETSNKIHLISILKSKLRGVHSEDLLEAIAPILNYIQEYSDRNLGKKLKSGIYVVDNVHSAENPTDEYNKHGPQETFQVLKEISSTVTDKLTEGTRSIKEKLYLLETTVKNLTYDNILRTEEIPKDVPKNKTEDDRTDKSTLALVDIEPILDINYNINALYKQYELNKINQNIELPARNKLFATKDMHCIIEIFGEFVRYIAELKQERESAELFVCRQFFLYVNKKNIKIEDLDSNSKEYLYLIEAFKALNRSEEHSCSCKYPLPTARNKKPSFVNIAKAIMANTNKYIEELTVSVPYLWKYILKDLKTQENIVDILALIVQYSDENVFKHFLDKFTYDTWDEALKLLIKLKKDVCLNCEKKYRGGGSISWTTFGTLMLESIGGSNTIKLLKRHSNIIPKGKLDGDFYQACIFSTAIGGIDDQYRKEAVHFITAIKTDNLADNTLQKQFSAVMERYLNRKYTKTASSDITNFNAENKVKCGHCNLPLKNEVLEDVKVSSCGHTYHKLCLNRNKDVCTVCKTS